MKISNSKKQLAKIISENGGWPGGNFSVQNGGHGRISFSNKTPSRCDKVDWKSAGGFGWKIECCKPLPNWHQTILSRDEYFHLYPAQDADGWIEWSGGERPVKEDVVVEVYLRKGRSSLDGPKEASYWDWSVGGDGGDIMKYRLHKPEQSIEQMCSGVTEQNKHAHVDAHPTIEQLAANYRDKLAIAQQAQEEADFRRGEAEAALSRLIIACADLGFEIKPKGKLETSGASVIDKLKDKASELAGSELNITDWRDLRVGDEVKARCHDGVMVGFVVEMEASDYFGDRPFRFQPDYNSPRWCTSQEFEFIRRP